MSWITEKLGGRVRGDTGETEWPSNTSASEKLCGALKGTARVTPRRDRERTSKLGLLDSIYRG